VRRTTMTENMSKNTLAWEVLYDINLCLQEVFEDEKVKDEHGPLIVAKVKELLADYDKKIGETDKR
jgi:hypothetical protein